MTALRGAVALAGALVVVATLSSAVRSVVLPRADRSGLTRRVFFVVRVLFRVRLGRDRSYERRDRVMSGYGPVSLLVLLATWLVLVCAGGTALFWGLGDDSLREAFVLSGSSLLTLGFARPTAMAQIVVSFVEAGIGLVLLALLITYLPSIYGGFSRREVMVASLETRAGSPPKADELLIRYWRVDRLESLHELWPAWTTWFTEIQETHTTFPALAFFRSPLPEHSWLAAAATILDAASLELSALDLPAESHAAFCIRSGYLSLRRIADYFRIPFDDAPAATDPISVTRAEFDEVCLRMERAGLPLRVDRDAAFRDFAGWRVNYDTVVLALAELTDAPRAQWLHRREREAGGPT